MPRPPADSPARALSPALSQYRSPSAAATAAAAPANRKSVPASAHTNSRLFETHLPPSPHTAAGCASLAKAPAAPSPASAPAAPANLFASSIPPHPRSAPHTVFPSFPSPCTISYNSTHLYDFVQPPKLTPFSESAPLVLPYMGNSRHPRCSLACFGLNESALLHR